ncbi:transglutaminase domain-containing protein [Patescibacteria group bacterium]
MNKEILDHYSKFSLYTNPGCYKDFLKALPDKIEELGFLIRKQIIHRCTLKKGNPGSNADLKYGDMDKLPWWRLRCEDDVLPNVVSMIAELLRLDSRGFVLDRTVENKIVVTCRFVSALTASILKSKGIPARVRSGFAPYFEEFPGSWDHWISQYWNKKEKRWITIDVDGSLDNKALANFNPYDVPKEEFDWAGKTWLGIRRGELDPENFINAGGAKGLMPASWAIFYDFHSLMNNEIIYFHGPNYARIEVFDKLPEKELKEIDELAELLLNPDESFNK